MVKQVIGSARGECTIVVTEIGGVWSKFENES